MELDTLVVDHVQGVQWVLLTIAALNLLTALIRWQAEKRRG